MGQQELSTSFGENVSWCIHSRKLTISTKAKHTHTHNIIAIHTPTSVISKRNKWFFPTKDMYVYDSCISNSKHS